MPRLNLFDKGKSYTFRSYFEMAYQPDEILAEFDVKLILEELVLPRTPVDSAVVEPLRSDLIKRIKRVQLSSEMARREVLVAPILFDVIELADAQLRIEYLLFVDDQLKGKLDYLLEGKQSLLVIEAKNDDLTRGFTQLAVEMIALSRRDSAQKMLYGAVTIGDVWLFGAFDVGQQQIRQDIFRYRVPQDLQDVLEILTGILTTDQLETA